ncbi:MAG: class I SAM-dependent methyltransferase [Planctomycetota bacterium]
MSEQPQPPAAFTFGRTRDWPGFFEAVAGGEPRQTLLDALDLFDAERSADADKAAQPYAIDLGCGEGRDTAELLRRGWRVLAIDGHPEGIQRLLAREDLVRADQLDTRVEAFEDLGMLPPCRLLNASFALPFCTPKHFARVWSLITGAIEPGGRFVGQIFGDRDEWASIPDRSHFSRAHTERLFGGFLLECLREEEKDAQDAAGNRKHWHVFHIVARKRDGLPQGQDPPDRNRGG